MTNSKEPEPAIKDFDGLSQRLRKLRLDRQLNLTDVAGPCEISASLLSQVERGLVVPSLNTLLTLSAFYGVSMFALFLDEAEQPRYEIIRRANRRNVTFGGANDVYQLLSPARNAAMSVFEVVTGPGQDGGPSHIHRHAGEECVIILAGSAVAVVDGVSHDLEVGDSIYYNAEVPHEFRAVGTETCRTLVAVTPAL